MKDFWIVIPTRNAQNLAKNLLAIDVRHGKPRDHVIVIDDDETGAVDAVTAQWAVQRIEGEKPFCFGRNVNRGIFRAAQDHVDAMILNDDALLETPGGFHLLAEAADPFGFMAPMVRGATCNEEQRIPFGTPHGLGMPLSMGPFQTTNHMVPFVCAYLRLEMIEQLEGCPGCNPDQLGGPLCEEFFGHVNPETGEKWKGANPPASSLVYGGEDDELCYRIRKAGYRLGIHPGVVVDHGSLESTFRKHSPSLPVAGARAVFHRIHGFEMGER